MNILSLHESRSHRSAADRLCRTITVHADDLRAVRLGKRFVLDDIPFRLFDAGRNTIYQIQCEIAWFLKMPRKGTSHVIEREILGAQACREKLSDCPGYRHPDVIRACTDKSFILTSAVSGKMMQRVLYRASFLPSFILRTDLQKQFTILGQALARLHTADAPDKTPLTRTADTGLRNSLRDASRNDETRQLIVETLHSVPDSNSVPTSVSTDHFVHGNFKLENVLIGAEGITIIDFENCGRGSVYEDLALLSAQLLCGGTALHMPTRQFETARRAFLAGYRKQQDFDPEILQELIARRVGEYYIRGFCGTESRPSIAGIPVSRRKTQRLVDSLLGDDSSITFPELLTV